MGAQNYQDDAAHRQEHVHRHPDYARGEHPEEPDADRDFARAERHGPADEHEGTFASGPDEVR